MKKEIPFRTEFCEPMLHGVKTCTARPRVMASKGDTFEAFGLEFVITAVGRSSLGSVCKNLWRDEGCDSPEHFREIWEKIHPRRGFLSEDPVWVHCFERKGDEEENV